MDRSTLFGMIAGFSLVLGTIFLQGDFILFISTSSAIIVIGGVLSSAVVSYSFKDVKKTISLLSETLKQTDADLRTDIELMNMFARKSRRDGLLAVEEDISNIEESFLRTGLQFVLDGVEKDTLLKILNDQLRSAERRLDKSVKILACMAEYAPAFGMIGTVIGLVLMLQNIQDPDALGAGLAVALLTTLYGTILANMVFQPLSSKLNHLGDQQIIRKQMFQSAIISIVEEENPRIMENKMLNYVSPAERAEYMAYYETETFDKKREDKLYANWKNFQFESWQNLTLALEAG